MKGLAPILAVLALAACEKPATPPATPAEAKPAQDLVTRWRMLLVPGRFAAEYSRSESDAVWARIVCEGRVLVLTEIHNDPTWDHPPAVGGRTHRLVLQEPGGRPMAVASAKGAVVAGDLEIRFSLPSAMFDLADSRPGLELALETEGAKEPIRTPLDTAARDVIMACTGGA